MANPTVQQLFDLTGRTALITGASGYLGTAFAEALAEAGARVVIASRSLEKARAAAEALGPRHLAVELDHLDEASIARGFAEAARLAGGLDVLVNNGNAPQPADWRNVTGAQFTEQLSNTTGYFLLARAMRDHAVERGAPASIILLGSMYGQVGSYPSAYEGVFTASPAGYHALKGGILQLGRHLAVYWAKDNIRVNCLSPGPFPTAKIPREMVERLKTHSPMSRMGEPHELKGALVFLASDASSYVTGHNLAIDGGWMAW